MNAPVAEGWIGIVVIWFVRMRKNVEIGRIEGGDVAMNKDTIV